MIKPPPAATPGVQRLARFDGLRGLAACVVAFGYHAGNLFAPGTLSGYGPVVDWSLTWGWTFVDLFFVISGFIFAHVYLSNGALGSGRALADFAVARIARLYPLHLLMLVLVAAAFWGKPENTAHAFALNLAMMQVFAEPMAHTFVGPSWSLSAEVLCYVLFALAAGSRRTMLMLVTWLAALGGLAWLVLFGAPGGPWTGDVFARGFFGFFTGQLLWHARDRMNEVSTPLALVMLGCGLVANVGAYSQLLPLGLLAWPAALILALRSPLMEGRIMLWLGDRSYAIYLIHLPLVDLFLKYRPPVTAGPVTVVATLALFVALVLALSHLTLGYVERPARVAIRKAWERWQPVPHSGAAATV